MKTIRRLGELHPGDRGVIRQVLLPEKNERLLEMGFVPGCEIEVLHQAPWSQDPIAVRVRGGLIALRRSEADFIEVEQERGHVDR